MSCVIECTDYTIRYPDNTVTNSRTGGSEHTGSKILLGYNSTYDISFLPNFPRFLDNRARKFIAIRVYGYLAIKESGRKVNVVVDSGIPDMHVMILVDSIDEIDKNVNLRPDNHEIRTIARCSEMNCDITRPYPDSIKVEDWVYGVIYGSKNSEKFGSSMEFLREITSYSSSRNVYRTVFLLCRCQNEIQARFIVLAAMFHISGITRSTKVVKLSDDSIKIMRSASDGFYLSLSKLKKFGKSQDCIDMIDYAEQRVEEMQCSDLENIAPFSVDLLSQSIKDMVDCRGSVSNYDVFLCNIIGIEGLCSDRFVRDIHGYIFHQINFFDESTTENIRTCYDESDYPYAELF